MVDLLVRNKFIILALSVLVGAIAWYSLRGSTPPAPLLVTTELTTASSAIDREVVTTLIELRDVNLNSRIFDDPVFKSLQDFGVQIVEEPAGRTNPFAPLGRDAESAPVTTTPNSR